MKPEERLPRLLDSVASSSPAPAGGSAAAVTPVAAVLLEKVARLSVKRWDGAGEAQSRANELRLRSEDLLERDADAFVGYLDAKRGGRDVDAARSLIINTPPEIERAAVRVVDLTQRLR